MRLGSRLGAMSRSRRSRSLSGLGPLRLVETFCAGARRAYCTAFRAIGLLTCSMTFVAQKYSFAVFLSFIYLFIIKQNYFIFISIHTVQCCIVSKPGLPWIWISRMDISMDISMCGYET